MNKNQEFGFKDLLVWQKAMDFADSAISVTENLNTPSKHFRLIEQLESSAASVPQNIAEGKGRRTDKEFVQYLYISRGSLYEAITLIYLFERRSWIDQTVVKDLEARALEIARMIKGLINSLYKE